MTVTDLSRYVYVPGVSEVGDIDLDETVIHDLSGRRVTEASLAAEGEALDRTRGLVPGGKSLSGGRKHSPTFQVVLGEPTAAKVRTAAKEAGMSVSKWLRRVIEDRVA